MIVKQEIINVLSKWQIKLHGSSTKVEGPWTTNGRAPADFAIEIPIKVVWGLQGDVWEDTSAKNYPVICYVWEDGRVELGEDGPDNEYQYGMVETVETAEELDKLIQLQVEFESESSAPLKAWYQKRFCTNQSNVKI